MNCISYNAIKGMHLEITTKCNACCPMCSRNFKGKTREKLPYVELSLEDCKKIFDLDFIRQLEFISICGVFGDPINATQLIDVIDYFYSVNKKIMINIYTNGGIRSKDWWIRLAKSLKNGFVIFGIDGIGEINSIHRRNTDYEKIMNNVNAYISAGGKAKWDFIAFRHNEHQIEIARETSERMGFESFQVKKTSRFLKALYESDEALDSTIFEYGKHPIYNSVEQVIGCLELPVRDEFRNSMEDTVKSTFNEYGTADNYFNEVNIDCQAIKTKGIFVSALGEVYPCCTVYQQVCYGTIYGVTDIRELNEYNLYLDSDSINAKIKSIKQIVEGDFFSKLQSSWHLEGLKEGKPKSCCRTCGSDFDMHKAQHK